MQKRIFSMTVSVAMAVLSVAGWFIAGCEQGKLPISPNEEASLAPSIMSGPWEVIRDLLESGKLAPALLASGEWYHVAFVTSAEAIDGNMLPADAVLVFRTFVVFVKHDAQDSFEVAFDTALDTYANEQGFPIECTLTDEFSAGDSIVYAYKEYTCDPAVLTLDEVCEIVYGCIEDAIVATRPRNYPNPPPLSSSD